MACWPMVGLGDQGMYIGFFLLHLWISIECAYCMASVLIYLSVFFILITMIF